jgi:oligoendopeptidase F
MSYAHLLVAEDGNNEKNKIFYQQMQEQITNIASSIVFFSLELNEVSNTRLKKTIDEAILVICSCICW